MKLIGITGSVLSASGQHICSTNSGKDTLARALAKSKSYQGHDVVIVALASTLVDIAIKSTGLDESFFTSQKLKNVSLSSLGGISPRQVLISIGKDLRARYGNDILARILYAKYKDSNYLVIVPDVRTKAEVEFFRNTGVVYSLTRYSGMTKKGFLNSIGIRCVDSITESTLPYSINDVHVSLDIASGKCCILYDNPLQIAA